MDKLVRRGGKGRIGRWWTASLGVHLGLLALLGLLHIAPAADEPPLLEVVLTELSGAAGASGGRTGGGGETLGAPEAAEAAGSVTKPDAPSPVAAATEPAPTPPSPPVPTARPEPTPVATQTAALAEAPLPPPPKPAAPAKPKPTVAKAKPKPQPERAAAPPAASKPKLVPVAVPPTPLPPAPVAAGPGPAAQTAPGRAAAGDAGTGLGPAGRGTGEAGAGRGALGDGPVENPGDDYLKRLKRHLKRHLVEPEEAFGGDEGQEGTAVVRFAFARDGRVLSAEISRSSGKPAIDKAALLSIWRASPLPPLPAAYRRDEARLALPVDYTVGLFSKLF